MKLTQTTSPVEIGEAISKPSTFKIAASKEAFKILSSGLYNNKKLAIIRELSCNAYDAHVAAGKKDQPFEIHLPTSFESYFEIRDEGIGLSHDEVINLYTTYFGTNKSESNEYVGALGLGSKSPFCYTEGFTVTSRYQGKTRIYSCYIDENGMPAVLLQEENDTPDDVNGLTVSFPVNQNDIWEFENQASTALEFFNPKPTLNTAIQFDACEYVIKTDTWGLRKGRYTKHGSGLRAIQGMVQYAVGEIDESRLDDGQKSIVHLPLDLFFNIGDLAVAASRETLSNDERTIGNIVKMLGSIKASLLDNIKTELKKCKTLWEARLKIFSMVNTEGIGHLANEALNKGELDGIYEGFILTKTKPIINQLDYPDVDIFVMYCRYGGNQKSRLGYDVTKYPSYQRNTYQIEFEVSKNSIFVINDVGFGVDKYVYNYLRDTNSYRYFITRKNKNISSAAVKKAGDAIVNALGNPPKIYVSEIKATSQELNKTPTIPSVARKLLLFNTNANVNHHREGYTIQGWSNGWEDATNMVLTPGPKYYVMVKRLEPQTGNFVHAEQFSKFIKAVKKSGLFNFSETDVVYGIPVGSPIGKGKDWIEFTSYIFNQLPAVVDQTRELALSLHLKSFRTNIESVVKEIGKRKLLDQTSPMQIFCNLLASARAKNETEISNLSVVVNKAVENKLFTVKHTFDFEALWKEVVKEYPLTRALDYYSIDVSDCVQYFKLIDDQRERQKQQLVVYSDTKQEEVCQ